MNVLVTKQVNALACHLLESTTYSRSLDGTQLLSFVAKMCRELNLKFLKKIIEN